MHRDIRSHGHTHYWLKGGRGSTKSSFLSLEIVLGMMRDPDACAAVYRRVGVTLQESVYAQLVWAINALGVAAYWRTGKSPMELEYRPTGHKILFRGADDPAKSKSIKLSRGYFKFLWFEELSEFGGMDDIRTITQSVIRGGGPVAIFYSYNPPKSAQNWVNAECLVPRPDRLVHHSTYLDVPPEWLGAAFLAEADMLRLTNETAYRHAYLGEVTGTGGQVFDNLRVREIARDERETFARRCNGLDFGFAVDPDALLHMYNNMVLILPCRCR
ncbi:MAG: PBSX family phage terminase large subunit [Eubacteriales bacterium]|nr:PBSX family phage terminase large subunit [Eubacteriales bacterium]